MLPINKALRLEQIGAVKFWLEDSIVSSATQPVVEMLIGLLLADEPNTREMALWALKRFFSKYPTELQELRARALVIVRELVAKDPAWIVRCVALLALPIFCKAIDEVTAAKDLAKKAGNSNIALERRASASTLRDPNWCE